MNGDKGDATIAVVVGKLLDALFVHLRDGAVVAGENDDEDGACSIVGERVGFAVNARKRKIGGRRTNGEDWVSLLRREEERKQKKHKRTNRFQGTSRVSGQGAVSIC